MAVTLRRAFLVVTPLVLAVVLWFHPPGGEHGVYEGIRHDADAWLFVHSAFLFFIPLMALAVFLLLRGLQSRAATVSRVALIVFLVFYTAYEVTVGLGTGILTDYANGLPAAEQAVVADAIQHYNEDNILGDPMSVSLVARTPGLDGRDGGGRGGLAARRSRLAADRARRAHRPLRHPSAARRPGRARVLRGRPPC